jgi:hypothetical protein
MEIYHGSRNGTLATISDEGIFGGIFGTSDARAAFSHGDYLYTITAPKVLTQNDLTWHLTEDELECAQKVVDRSFARRRYSLEELVKAVFEDGQIDDMTLDEMFEAQALRGKIAKALGYDAVEMSDEHGTSYLCLDTCTISKANGHSNY